MFKHQLTYIPLKKFKQQLPLLTIDLPAAESVTVMFLANTGSRYEPIGKEGIAHFFEHMVFKGSANYPNAKILARTLDSVGAEFNAFTSKEYTGYYVKAAANNFALALDVLSDMLFAPLLKQSDIDREKGVIIEELNMYVDTPQAHIANVFEELLFAQESLAHNIVGNKASIRSLTSADFQNFLNNFYGPENLLLVLAGGLDKIAPKQKLLADKVAATFNKLNNKRGQNQKLAVPKVERKVEAEQSKGAQPTMVNEIAFSKRRFKLVKRASEQAHFVMAWPALDLHHPDRYVLSVLAVILGGNMSSRLFTEVREKRGLCYYVRSDFEYYHDCGYLGASAGVDPNRLREAIQASKDVFYNLANKRGQVGETGLISAAELLRAQNYLKGRTLLNLEESNNVAQFYGFKQLLNDKILSPKEVIAKIEAVTVKDLQRLAKLIFQKEQLRFAIIGNFANAKEIQQWVFA
ncbi:MAG: insulinase family protein [Candidatus Pacebacteria bacterium]|nr:insulinase family protein [Candidatus Paceibacterota bacterium]